MRPDRCASVSDRYPAPRLLKSLVSRRSLAAAVLAPLLGNHDLIAAPSTQPASTFTVATNRAPSDFDPHSAYDAGSGMALSGPYEGLIRLQPGTIDRYVGNLAEAWEANADRSTWTFRIRPGVTFHDGSPLDAEAARASFERVLTLGLAPSQVLGRFITDPARITAPDTRTLVFDLGRPQPLFEAAMASAYGTAVVNAALLRRHDVGGDWGAGWAQQNVDGLGTGPYRIVGFDPVEGVRFERFDDYWGGWDGPYFDRIVIRVVTEPETRLALIEHGDADVAATLPLSSIPSLERIPDLVVDRRYNLAVQYIAMNASGVLSPPAARQALCWAFPYDEVIEGIYRGYAKRAIGPVAELCRGFAPETFVYQTDLDQARTLLREAGVGEGTSLTILLAAGVQDTVAIAEAFQANLAAVGIELSIQQVDFATYVDIVLGDLLPEERPNLFPMFWQPDYNDGWNHLAPQVSCAAGSFGNAGQYCNPRVETLLATARDAADAETYRAALAEIQQVVTRDDPAAIYVAQAEWLTVLRRDVAGFVPNPVASVLLDFRALRRAAG